MSCAFSDESPVCMLDGRTFFRFFAHAIVVTLSAATDIGDSDP